MERAAWAIAAACLVVLAWARPATADPPPPKVCVVVAGDPDEAARSAAEVLSTAVAGDPGLRGVADADARAALRGEAPAPDGTAELASARRALRGTDADAATLDRIATALGCGVVLEVASRPAGTMLRAYDSVHHRWQEALEVAVVEPALVARVVVPAARAASARGPAPAAGTRQANAATAARSPEQPSTLQRLWPYLAAGGAAAVLVTVFLLAQEDDPGTTTITVVHGGR